MEIENQEGNPSEVTATEVVNETPKSMDDTIRETLRELQSKGVETSSETPDTPEQKAEKIRDTQGKFAKEVNKDVTPVVGETQTQVKAAPNTWRKEIADKWSTLPPEVQSEVERREADFHKGIEQYKEKANFALNVEKAIAPYQATLNQLQISPEKAISELMSADHKLRYGSPAEKNAYFAQLAQSYGVDIGQVQQPQNQHIDPNIAYFQHKIAHLEGQVHQQTMMGQQKESEALNNEITKFSSDPSHRHFESVKSDMAGLLQAGLAKDLSDAYEQAIWRNPTIRASVLAEQQAEAKKEATQKAQAAKTAASVNVKTRPSMPVSQPIGTMDDTIRSTLRRLQNA